MTRNILDTNAIQFSRPSIAFLTTLVVLFWQASCWAGDPVKDKNTRQIEAQISAMKQLKNEYKDAVYWMPPQNPRIHRGEHLPPMQAKKVQLEISNIKNESIILGLNDASPYLDRVLQLASETNFRKRHQGLQRFQMQVTNAINNAHAQVVRSSGSTSPFRERASAEYAARNSRWYRTTQILNVIDSQVREHNQHPTPEAQAILLSELRGQKQSIESEQQRLANQLFNDRAMLAVVTREIKPTESALATYDERIEQLRKQLEASN